MQPVRAKIGPSNDTHNGHGLLAKLIQHLSVVTKCADCVKSNFTMADSWRTEG